MTPAWFTLPLAYLFGAIPVGILVSGVHGVKITEVGSGNVGATNVARTVGKKAGIVVLIGDLLKGLIPVLIARIFTSDPLFLSFVAFFTVAGHCFTLNHAPIRAAFPQVAHLRGGKGASTSLGCLAAVDIRFAFLLLGVFIVVVATTKIVSLASVSAAAALPVYAAFAVADSASLVPVAMCSVLVIARHRQNIERMLQGEEKKFSFGSKSAAPETR